MQNSKPETYTTPKLINGMPVVGVCNRCGREFLTMLGDGTDHYGIPDNRRAAAWRECGGRIELVANTYR